MAILDKYLKPISDGRADELHLYANVSPTYLLEQRPVKELAQRLGNDDIMALLKEIVEPDSLAELEERRRLNYQYRSSFGSFRCQFRWSDNELKTRFTKAKDAPLRSPSQEMNASIPDVLAAPEPAAPAPPQKTSEPIFKSSDPQLTAVPAPAPPAAAPVLPTMGASTDSLDSALAPNPHQVISQSVAQLQALSGAFAAVNPYGVNLGDYSLEQQEVIKALFANIDQEKEIDRLFELLLNKKGSDLHISSDEHPVMRIDGSIRRLENLPVLDSLQIAQLIAPIMPERNRKEFIEEWDTDFAYEIQGLGRFRSNIFMDRKGVGAVFRIIPSSVVTAEQLGLPKAVKDLCYLSKGLVLVTGPTGSGKSTTLCGMVDLINRTRDDHVLTIEDPIEFVHENKRCLINQREVGVHTDSFKKALRAALREDPDVILVGELRDLETMAIAIETAETGHLVFGTLHTSSAVSTVDRLIDQFPGERQQQIRLMLANSLKGVISQTLLKKKEGGRIAAMEVLIVTHGVANLIRQQKIHQIMNIMQTSQRLGMQCLNDVLMDYVNKGFVTVEEAYYKAVDKINFVEMLNAYGIPTDQLGAIGDDIIE